MTNEELHVLGKKIGEVIGYDYSPTENDTTDALFSRFVTLSKPSVGSLRIEEIPYGAKKGRLEIGIKWPDYESKPYGVNKAEITVSGEKSSEQIANDIKKRLLPILEPLYQDALHRQRCTADFKRARHEASIRIAGALHRPAPASDNDKPHFYINNQMGYVEVNSATSITIKIACTTVEKAIRVIEAIEK